MPLIIVNGKTKNVTWAEFYAQQGGKPPPAPDQGTLGTPITPSGTGGGGTNNIVLGTNAPNIPAPIVPTISAGEGLGIRPPTQQAKSLLQAGALGSVTPGNVQLNIPTSNFGSFIQQSTFGQGTRPPGIFDAAIEAQGQASPIVSGRGPGAPEGPSPLSRALAQAPIPLDYRVRLLLYSRLLLKQEVLLEQLQPRSPPLRLVVAASLGLLPTQLRGLAPLLYSSATPRRLSGT